MKRSERDSIVLLSFCSIFLLSYSDVGAQAVTPNPSSAAAAALERRRSEQDLRALPLKLRERREENLADPKLRAQMNEDFLRIQAIRRDMVATFSAGGLIDPGRLEDLAAEVKRRASRLRSMLALSDESEAGDAKTKLAKTVEALNDQAFNLCIEISRFTENPIFKPQGVYTLSHANEADRTLGSVIRLAESIRRNAESLRKK